MSSETIMPDSGSKTFKVAGEDRELFFSAAIRFRLFLNVEPQNIQAYVTSDIFKLNALILLLGTKEHRDSTTAEVLDFLEEIKISNSEMEQIIGWVREKAIAFMLAEAQSTAEALEKIIPQAKALSNSLTGLQD